VGSTATLPPVAEGPLRGGSTRYDHLVTITARIACDVGRLPRGAAHRGNLGVQDGLDRSRNWTKRRQILIDGDCSPPQKQRLAASVWKLFQWLSYSRYALDGSVTGSNELAARSAQTW